ncbi:hypothetical protein FKM82_017441 [Ascaphus truei]
MKFSAWKKRSRGLKKRWRTTRTRRQNLRIRNVPESVLPDLLRPYLIKLFTSVCSDLDHRDLELDRAHRALGPRSDDPNRRRDLIVRFHSYTAKKKVLAACREMDTIAFQDEVLQVFNDLSKITINKRRELKPLTLFLGRTK